MEERRKFARFKAPFRFKYSCAKDSGEFFPGEAKDISMEGIKIVIDGALQIPSDAPISFHILFPEKTLEITGELVWIRDCNGKNEAGIRFIDASDLYKEEINNYILKYHNEEVVKNWRQM